MTGDFIKFAKEFADKAGIKNSDAEADANALKIYMSLGHSEEEAKRVFEKAFKKDLATPARVRTGVIEVSKEHFKLKPYQKDFLANHEILHFEHHRKNKKLRKLITGKQVQEMIDYLSDCGSSNIKEYSVFLKRDFRFKLWWYHFKIKFVSLFLSLKCSNE